MTEPLALLVAAAGLVGAGFSFYLLLLSLAGLPPDSPTRRDLTRPLSRLVVLIPAHNEELLIARCVGSLMLQTYPPDRVRVIVVADNCDDRTAEIALQSGAEVMSRFDPDHAGKGQALRWALDRFMNERRKFDAVVVVDADSVAAPDLLDQLEREFAAGNPVVQADYEILREPRSSRTELIAAGFMLFHRVRLGGRARLGMAAALVGNGMLFGREVLEAHPWSAFSPAEDLEYTVDLRLAGIRPRFAALAHVEGPAPASGNGALRQRVRWEGGRFHVVRTRLADLVRGSVARRDAALDRKSVV